MRTFVAVADADSFSVAAQRLGTTQSTVSRQIVALERHLRARLINRTTRSLTLTAEGSTFYEAAMRALAAVDEAQGMVGPVGDPQGLLRVTMPLTLAESRLMPIIADFLAHHPRIQIDLRVSDHALNLVADSIDVAIRVGQLVDSGLVARRIGIARRVIVASPAYLARAGTPATPADLTAHNCIGYSLLATGGRWRLSDGTEIAVSGSLRADSPNALKAAALAGIGIAVNARWLFERELADGSLVELFPDTPPEAMPIHAVLPSGRHIAARTRLFIDHVAAMLARDPLCAPG
jgi:LysR family transcriptional regulator, regulator for bpeEF and oprC